MTNVSDDAWRSRLGADGASLRRSYVRQRIAIWVWAALLMLLVISRQVFFAATPSDHVGFIAILSVNIAFLVATGLLQVTTKPRIVRAIQGSTGYFDRRTADRCLFSTDMFDLWLMRRRQLKDLAR